METKPSMKIFLIPAILFAVFFVFGNEAKAAEYYVSPSGSDSSSGLSGAPFKTIQKAADIVNPGDTVIVRNGTYTDTDSNNIIVLLTRGGTSSNWITFKSENKWGAVLDGQSNTTGYGILTAYDTAYINIENFEIKGVLNSGFFVGAGTNHIAFRGNKVHDIGRKQFACTDPNIYYSKSGSSIDKEASYLTYDSNIFYNIGRLPNGCGSIDYNHDHAIYPRGSHGTIINNIFYDNKAGWGIHIYDSSNLGQDDWKIINNTFYESMASVTSSNSGQILLSSGSDNAITNIVIENNIFHTAGNWAIYNYGHDSQGSITIRNNICYNTGRLLLYETSNTYYTVSGNITGNPLFTNLSGRDFHIQSTSPAIDKGNYIAGHTYDADGNPIIGPPDIGAYEYVGAQVADTTPPSIPTDLSATSVSSSQINLSWNASTDNVGVNGYKVYRDGSLQSTVNSPQLTYQDTGLTPSITYTYTVSAYDNAGNISAQSAQASATTNPDSVVYLSDLSWISATNGWGPVEKDKSNGDIAAGDGKTITLNGTTYAKGLGVHAASDVQYNLAGKYSTFMSDIGVDDEVGTNGSVIFQVFADGVKLYDSGTMTVSSQTKQVNVDVTGKNTLQLVVTDAGNGTTSDHADWANARIIYADTTSPAAPSGLSVQ